MASLQIESEQAFWKQYYERECMKSIARVMRACKVTQVDISHIDLCANDRIAIEDHPGFIRIKGEFKLEDTQ